MALIFHAGASIVPFPKRDLVGSVQILLQTRRLKWAPTLPGTEILAAELASFRARISASGRDTYGAADAGGDDWRQGAHDDTNDGLFAEGDDDDPPAWMRGYVDVAW